MVTLATPTAVNSKAHPQRPKEMRRSPVDGMSLRVCHRILTSLDFRHFKNIFWHHLVLCLGWLVVFSLMSIQAPDRDFLPSLYPNVIQMNSNLPPWRAISFAPLKAIPIALPDNPFSCKSQINRCLNPVDDS